MFADGSSGEDLRTGVDGELLARLTDSRALAKLNYSAAELDLDYLLESRIPPRQRRRRGYTPRHSDTAATTHTAVAAAEDPPF